MADAVVSCHAVLNCVFRKMHICKIETLVDPQGYDCRVGDYIVGQDIAVVLRAGDLANFRDMGLGGLVEMQW